MNVTLLGNRVFADVTKLKIILDIRRALNLMTGALIKERGGHFETQGSFERVSYEDGCGD